MAPEGTSVAAQRHEYLVVGAGLMGLSVAWSLSQRGRDVLVLEAATVGHDHSGSKGQSRIFRLSYDDPLYAQMARVAGGLWHTLEAEVSTTLLYQTGQLNFGDQLSELARTLGAIDVPAELLSPTETHDRFPHLAINGPSLFEPTSGVLVADACLEALRQTGSFALREDAPVDYLSEDEDGVMATLADGTRLMASVVIVCAGPASAALLGGTPPTAAALPSLQQVVYLQPRAADITIPPFIEWGRDMTYGLPVVGQSLMKVSHHTTGPEYTGPADSTSDDTALLAQLHQASARLLPDYVADPVQTERCQYDNTIDSDFVLDRRGRIVIGCGSSGHGFKFGPLLGELLADLAQGVEPSFDLRRFSLNRAITRTGANP
jgi:sarcosine oxidase